MSTDTGLRAMRAPRLPLQLCLSLLLILVVLAVGMALTPLLRVENDVSEIVSMLTEIYIDTKQKKGADDGK